MPAWKFFILTFGCKVNQYESQSLREAWQRLGGSECPSPAEADVLCVNSCAVTAKGERDARNAVFRLRREAPGAKLILTGCAARLFADYRPRPGAQWAAPDLLVPQEEKSRLLAGPWAVSEPRGAHEARHTPTPTAKAASATGTAFPPFRIASFKRARPVLKIQDGCAHRCTYCIVPLTRGKPRSRRAEEALAEARRLLEAGHVEIMLSGINLRQYGRDDPACGDFWDLLRILDKALAPEFAGRARFRISSLEPSQLDARGIETLTSCRMLCPHLHISLQHASTAVLRRMGRGHYTILMLEKAVTALAAHWPVMGLGADILTGFPGESEADLRLLLELIERLPLSYAHVFPYSPRPSTAACNFAGQLPQTLKLERAARVREAVDRRRRAFWAAQLTLPRMLVVPDSIKSATSALDTEAAQALCKGVNEYYVPCFFRPPRESSSMPVPVRPTALNDKGLLTEPL